MERLTVLLIQLSLVAATISCTKKDDSSGGAGPTAPAATATTSSIIVPTPTPGSGYNPSGAWAPLNTDAATLADYTGRPLNNPRNAKVGVALTQNGSGVFSGSIDIYYDDDANGTGQFQTYKGTFTSGGEGGLNTWVTDIGGLPAFKGFFQDIGGGLILVVNSRNDRGQLGGDVYYFNFDLSICDTMAPNMPDYCNPYQGPLLRCWQISLGPYDCRDFLVDEHGVPQSAPVFRDNFHVDTTSRKVPARYKHLGSFVGLAGTALK